MTETEEGIIIRGDDDFILKDSGQRKTFSGGMERDVGDDKPNFTLLYYPMLKRWASHMAKGAKKYGKKNWMKAEGQEELERFQESAIRHMYQWLNGEVDEDHASAVFFNITGAEYVRSKMNAK